jgi:hypothetical protein
VFTVGRLLLRCLPPHCHNLTYTAWETGARDHVRNIVDYNALTRTCAFNAQFEPTGETACKFVKWNDVRTYSLKQLFDETGVQEHGVVVSRNIDVVVGERL